MSSINLKKSTNSKKVQIEVFECNIPVPISMEAVYTLVRQDHCPFQCFQSILYISYHLVSFDGKIVDSQSQYAINDYCRKAVHDNIEAYVYVPCTWTYARVSNFPMSCKLTVIMGFRSFSRVVMAFICEIQQMITSSTITRLYYMEGHQIKAHIQVHTYVEGK